MDNNLELIQLKENLKDLKIKFYAFLVQSYKNIDSLDPGKDADIMISNLDDVVDKIIKRQSFKLNFLGGGSHTWYSEILKFLAVWIDIEYKICQLMAQNID